MKQNGFRVITEGSVMMKQQTKQADLDTKAAKLGNHTVLDLL